MKHSIWLLIIVVHLAASELFAQSHETDTVGVESNCEVAIVSLERVMTLANEAKGRVFIISRRASNEMGGVDWSRLKYTRMVMTQFRSFSKEKVTIAIGELTDDSNGHLEFWLGTDLLLRIYVKKNQQLCLAVPSYG